MLLFTTLNTVGRMVGGYMPERLLHRYGTPRWEAKHTLENLPVENNDTLVIMAAINLLAAVGMLRCDRERPFAALHCQRRGACAHAQDGVCCGGVADGVRGRAGDRGVGAAASAALRHVWRLCVWLALEPHAGTVLVVKTPLPHMSQAIPAHACSRMLDPL